MSVRALQYSGGWGRQSQEVTCKTRNAEWNGIWNGICNGIWNECMDHFCACVGSTLK